MDKPKGLHTLSSEQQLFCLECIRKSGKRDASVGGQLIDILPGFSVFYVYDYNLDNPSLKEGL